MSLLNMLTALPTRALIALFCFALVTMLAGCDFDMLEEEPTTFLSEKSFFRTKDDAVASVNGIYADLNEGLYRGDIFRLVDFPSLQSTDNEEGGDFDLITWTSTNGTIFSVWEESYQIINRANVSIDRIPSVEMEESLKNRLIGEARFLRGLMYFNLIRLYGNIPVVMEPTTDLQGLNRSNVDTHGKVWDLIIEDFQFAEDALPASFSGKDVGRATRGAAKAMLAKVHLQRSGLAQNAPNPSLWGVEGVNEWQEALDKTQEVIDSGEYGLFENYADAFDADTKNGKEHVFSIQFLAGIGRPEGMFGLFNDTGVRALPTSHPFGGASNWTGTRTFYDMWDENDSRFPVTWTLSFEYQGEIERFPESNLMRNPHIKKYRVRPTEKELLERFSANIPVIRYSDVLLMHSEAANETGAADPFFGLNKVRERAGLEPLSGLSQQELRDAIFRERSFELAFEGKAFFDYQRFGLLVERVTMRPGVSNVEEFRYVYPIPKEAMDQNPELEQNPGY